MGYDGKIWRPDFQANTQLPSWVPMGGDDQQSQNAGKATNSLVEALKARMAGNNGSQSHTDTMMPAAHAQAPIMMPHEAAGPIAGEHGMAAAAPIAGAAKGLGALGGAGGAGGGMASL